MVNKLGKALVLAQVALSVLAMTWAAGIFLQFTDWGWREPRKELDVRVASEYDKRAAALKETLKARDLALVRVKPAQDALRDAQQRFPANHLYYVQELARLRASTGAVDLMAILYKDGFPQLDTPNNTGKPLLEKAPDGVVGKLLRTAAPADGKGDEEFEILVDGQKRAFIRAPGATVLGPDGKQCSLFQLFLGAGVEVTLKDGILHTTGKGDWVRVTPSPNDQKIAAKVSAIPKSYEAYKADVKELNEAIAQITKEVRKWTEAAKGISQKLLGTDESGQVVAPGLYALLEMEKKAQDQILFEKEYLQPRWARALEEAELFMTRRNGLEQTLKGLQSAMKKKGLVGP